MNDMTLCCGGMIWETGVVHGWHSGSGITRGFSSLTGQAMYQTVYPGCFEWCSVGFNAIGTDGGTYHTVGYATDNSPPNYPDINKFLLGYYSINCTQIISPSDITGLSNYGFVVCGMMQEDLQLGNDTLHVSSGKLFIAKFNGINNNTSIEEELTLHPQIISPNPSSGQFTIRSRGTLSSVEILNMLGEQVYFSDVPSSEYSIDLSNRAAGIYFIDMMMDGVKNTEKIIIK